MDRGVVVLTVVAVLFSAFTLFETFYISSVPLVGHTVSGTVSLYVSSTPSITIHSPENTTYHFAVGSPYTLPLNVSTSAAGEWTWSYTLEDVKHGIIVAEDVPFEPNTTFNATRWNNRLTIKIMNLQGDYTRKSVEFFVSVPNSAPLIGNISSPLFACESQRLLHTFNATDADEESLYVSASPSNPFFVFPDFFIGQQYIESFLFSAVLGKNQIGNYSLSLSVSDGQYSDSKNVNITVIETNEIPSVEDIGVRTVYLQGEQSVFDEQIGANDVEDGSGNDGKLIFNISFNGGIALFNITLNGSMHYTPSSSHLGVHNITYCVNDTPISYIHPNINLCANNGQSNVVCKNFSLTVTNENRNPTILNYYPALGGIAAVGTQIIQFNVTTYDPDGTIPDVRWYVDGALIQYSQGNHVSNFNYAFLCGVGGIRHVSANITDGLAGDSIMWNINLTSTPCPVVPVKAGGGGGGGGGGGYICVPQWGCDNWNVCQNAQRSLEIGILSGDDYRIISEGCFANNLDEINCGFQIRECLDGANCNTTRARPDKVQFCIYTSDPSCADNIKNCHDGSCEILVDCGGPCGTCPSCSDRTQNQGELGVDCGGPCPFQCKPETPLIKYSVFRTILLWLFWLLLLLLMILLVSRIVKLIKVHNEIKKERRIQSALSR